MLLLLRDLLGLVEGVQLIGKHLRVIERETSLVGDLLDLLRDAFILSL